MQASVFIYFNANAIQSDFSMLSLSINEGSEGQRKGNDSGHHDMFEASNEQTQSRTTTVHPAKPIPDITQKQPAEHSAQVNDHQYYLALDADAPAQTSDTETPADESNTAAVERSLKQTTEEHKQDVPESKIDKDVFDPNGGTLEESGKEDIDECSKEDITLERSVNMYENA